MEDTAMIIICILGSMLGGLILYLMYKNSE